MEKNKRTTRAKKTEPVVITIPIISQKKPRSFKTQTNANITERKFEKTDLNTIVDDIREEMAEALLENKAEIITNKLGTVNIIVFQFTQLLLNLISNSLKFSKPDTPIRIIISSSCKNGSEIGIEKLEPDRSYCHVCYQDNGIGFEASLKDKIFEVVKKIMENHNGIITANSEPMQGARFDIYFPNDL